MFRRIFRKALSFLPGRYRCPICESNIHRFLPLPRHYHENRAKYGCNYPLNDAETLNYKQYQCPVCFSSDRDRLYALFINKRLVGSQVSTITMLEIGPSIPLGQFLGKTGRFKLRTADLMADDVDDRIDITDMACYRDGAFDSFICSHVLEHVPDDRKALNELYRILKFGGWGILMVPISLSLSEIDEDPSVLDVGERWRRFGQDDHIRRYSKDGFLSRVEAAGFLVRQYDHNYFGKAVYLLNGISERSMLYVVEK